MRRRRSVAEADSPMMSLAPGASPHAVRVLAAALADEKAEGAPIVLRQVGSRGSARALPEGEEGCLGVAR